MKFEILAVLTSGPRHGYDIMLEIEAKTGMRPSAGSIYPALQMLEDGDFVRGEERDGHGVEKRFETNPRGDAAARPRPFDTACMARVRHDPRTGRRILKRMLSVATQFICAYASA